MSREIRVVRQAFDKGKKATRISTRIHGSPASRELIQKDIKNIQ